MGFETEVAAEGMDGVNYADTQAGSDVVNDFTDGLIGNLQEEF